MSVSKRPRRSISCRACQAQGQGHLPEVGDVRVDGHVSHLAHEVRGEHRLVDARGVVVVEDVRRVLARHVHHGTHAARVRVDEFRHVIRAAVEDDPAVGAGAVLGDLGHGELRQRRAAQPVRDLRVQRHRLGHAAVLSQRQQLCVSSALRNRGRWQLGRLDLQQRVDRRRPVHRKLHRKRQGGRDGAEAQHTVVQRLVCAERLLRGAISYCGRRGTQARGERRAAAADQQSEH
eukprot:scaffold10650_cov46-Phaeocystis_antarctica.AAC.2